MPISEGTMHVLRTGPSPQKRDGRRQVIDLFAARSVVFLKFFFAA